jgi:hypothetical protein
MDGDIEHRDHYDVTGRRGRPRLQFRGLVRRATKGLH